MRTFTDAKVMARALRNMLSERQLALSHSECLEIVAQQLGAENWNVLAAKIDQAAPGESALPQAATDGIRFSETIPILRIFDVEKAKEFYVGFLGFTIDWEHRFGDNFPLYAQVSRGGIKLHLSEHHGDASPGSTVFVWMRGIGDYHRELLGKDYKYYKPGLEDAPWDARVMQVADPFGNRLRFSEPNKADDTRA
ncbi:MAG: glyoxalase superfamily protein [Hyphomicrobium sp.]|jgi:catechol 2,3-dioxygenase-like lactoylglutathione lyase family enzyme